ncbi:MAG: site-specific DNA-methyltransferase, partial [Desulfobacteraceae bacterium]|nr:site-specific DNA-methyltransferase [Desulfobacteraceae bacterium]
IDFLAQLENFQKKLWLKKKFVVETNYCITLDRVPEALYPEIADNEAQRKEWVTLFAIDEIKGDLHSRKYSEPLTEKFLKENLFLVLDTGFFDGKFKEKLIASVDDFDEQCDGLLIHSENFQALNLLQKRYREQVKCVYIDPPYNTSATEILYKNEYKHSSWLSLMQGRVASSFSHVRKDGVFCIAIDDFEGAKLQGNLDQLMGFENRLGNIVVVHNPGGRHDDKFIATAHEYCFFYGKDILHTSTNFLPLEKKDIETFKHEDNEGAYRTREFRRSGNNSTREARPKMFYPLLIKGNEISLVHADEYSLIYDKDKSVFNDTHLNQISDKYRALGFDVVLPIDPKGIFRVWRWAPDSLRNRMPEVFAEKRKGGYVVKVKDRLESKPGLKPKSVWYKSRYTAALGTNILKDIIGNSGLFSYPKSISTIEDSIRISADSDSLILDYFAGSGTTAHALINLNREDNGQRKYILMEMGDYFDTVLKPRIQKVIYSASWKNGKPTARHTGVSHCFKYLRLESYEDTLNNLSFNNNSTKAYQDNPNLYEDYMLRYLLDVETHGSQSLLNIDAFADPCAYKLKVKQPGSDEYVVKNVDLLETFNYLIGLRVVHIAEPLSFTAKFKREADPELPENQQTRLI